MTDLNNNIVNIRKNISNKLDYFYKTNKIIDQMADCK